MRKKTAAIISGVFMVLIGIAFIRLSVFSKNDLVPFPIAMATFPRMEGESIPSSLLFSFPKTRNGINISGTLQGYVEGQPTVMITDPEGNLFYSYSSYPPPSQMEFDCPVAGWYRIDFNIIFGDNSLVVVYNYTSKLGIVYPYKHLFYPGIGLGAFGIGLTAVGLLVPSEKREGKPFVLDDSKLDVR